MGPPFRVRVVSTSRRPAGPDVTGRDRRVTGRAADWSTCRPSGPEPPALSRPSPRSWCCSPGARAGPTSPTRRPVRHAERHSDQRADQRAERGADRGALRGARPSNRPRSPSRPHPISMAALAQADLTGGDLRLGAVRERTPAYTSYDVTFASTTMGRGTEPLRISGVLNVPTGRGSLPRGRAGARLHRPGLLRPRPGHDARARVPRPARLRRAARRLPQPRRVDRRPARRAGGPARLRRRRGRRAPRAPDVRRRAGRPRPDRALRPLDGWRRDDEGARRRARPLRRGRGLGVRLEPRGGELRPVPAPRRAPRRAEGRLPGTPRAPGRGPGVLAGRLAATRSSATSPSRC